MPQIVDLAEGVPPAFTCSSNVDHFAVEVRRRNVRRERTQYRRGQNGYEGKVYCVERRIKKGKLFPHPWMRFFFLRFF